MNNTTLVDEQWAGVHTSASLHVAERLLLRRVGVAGRGLADHTLYVRASCKLVLDAHVDCFFGDWHAPFRPRRNDIEEEGEVCS